MVKGEREWGDRSGGREEKREESEQCRFRSSGKVSLLLEDVMKMTLHSILVDLESGTRTLLDSRGRQSQKSSKLVLLMIRKCKGSRKDRDVMYRKTDRCHSCSKWGLEFPRNREGSNRSSFGE